MWLKKQKYTGGYVAIASVLVILAVTLTISISVALLSIDGAQVALSGNQSQLAVSITDSCVADALLYLSNNDALPASITLPEGSCTVVQNSHVGDNWVFTVSNTVDGFSRSIQLDVDKSTAIVVNSWQEV